MSPLERKFHAAVSIIQHLPKSGPIQPPLSTMLQFYALYKQATEGSNTTTKPAFYDIVRKTKWDAWTKLGTLSKEEAMQRYIDEFIAIVDSTMLGSNVEEMIKSLGTLYEAVNEEDIDLLLGPTMDKLFARAGSRKLIQLKDKMLKSRQGKDVPDGVDRRHETRQSQYYMEAPSSEDVRDTQDAYQLRSGELGRRVDSGCGASVTTWSQCLHQTPPDSIHQKGSVETSNSVSKQSRLTPSALEQTRLYNQQHISEATSGDRLQELSVVSEAVVSIEQELNNVAEKLNSISKLYKSSQCYSSVSIPTLSLILVWPVLTQFVFMWYSSRGKYFNQRSR